MVNLFDPYTIAFGGVATMMRAGLLLNIIGIFVVTLFAYYIAPMVF
jgi:hypothetical protein